MNDLFNRGLKRIILITILVLCLLFSVYYYINKHLAKNDQIINESIEEEIGIDKVLKYKINKT